MKNSKKILNVDNVISGYGEIQILHGVSIEVYEKEIVTIIGPNGCGKSTLMKTIFGLLKPTSGAIEFIIDNKMTEIPYLGPLPITVPGAVDGWFEMHDKYG